MKITCSFLLFGSCHSTGHSRYNTTVVDEAEKVLRDDKSQPLKKLYTSVLERKKFKKVSLTNLMKCKKRSYISNIPLADLETQKVTAPIVVRVKKESCSGHGRNGREKETRQMDKTGEEVGQRILTAELARLTL